MNINPTSTFQQRLTAHSSAETASVPVTAASIQEFIRSLGLDPEDFLKPKLSKNKRVWSIEINPELDETNLDEQELPYLLSKKLGRPFSDGRDLDTEEAVVIWVIKGKGVVEYNIDQGTLYVRSLENGPEAIGYLVTLLDADYETRFKDYTIDAKKRILDYQLYEGPESRRYAVGLIKRLCRKLRIQGWDIHLSDYESDRVTIFQV